LEKGAVVLDYLGDFRSFVEATSNFTFRISNDTRAYTYTLIESAGISRPFIDVEKAYLDILSGYEKLGLQISLLPSASWLKRWTISRVEFEPQWANPVWSLFQFPIVDLPCCTALLICVIMLLIQKKVGLIRLISQSKGMTPLCFKDGWVCCSCRLMFPSGELNDCDGCTDLACERCIGYFIIYGDDYWYCPCCQWMIPLPPPPPAAAS
jgi:hypothetical protein